MSISSAYTFDISSVNRQTPIAAAAAAAACLKHRHFLTFDLLELLDTNFTN
jgi:hypothetical protein